MAGALRELGVGRGDTVGIFMPLLPETAIGLLAIAYLGAIAVPAFSGYGPDALASRLADAKAKVLLTVDGVSRRGKGVATKSIVDDALRNAPSVRSVLVFDRVGVEVPMQSGRDFSWRERTAAATPLATYERTSANDQVMLLYTSGSTGKPKGANHVHAGFPLKCMIDQHLCMDVKPGDRMLWFTDMGWMMGPFLVFGSLGLGASIVLYEGTPDYPTPDRLWNICATHGVTHLGIAPTAIRSLMTHGDELSAPPRFVRAAHPGQFRRAVEHRTVEMVCDKRRTRCRADHQLLGRHGDRRRHHRRVSDDAAGSQQLPRTDTRDGRRRVRCRW